MRPHQMQEARKSKSSPSYFYKNGIARSPEKHTNQFSSYCGRIVRIHVGIRIKDWQRVPAVLKKNLWEEEPMLNIRCSNVGGCSSVKEQSGHEDLESYDHSLG